MLAALAVYSANPFGILLPAVDDCHYARKGVEMSRNGGFFSVTWNGVPSFTYPSLHFWLLGRSFAWFGENDLAARLPSIAMALGTLLIVYRMGVKLLGETTAVGAVALLAVSPYFADNARGCMTEIPLTFWVSLTILIFLEGLVRPRRHLLIALSLGAGILTKSIMGLFPLPVLGACALLASDFRRPFRAPWVWTGIGLGLALGATWSIHQALRFGPDAMEAHYLEGIGGLVSRPLSLAQRFLGYPVFFLERFHPAILPGLAGALLAWRQVWRRRDPGLLLLLLWLAVPLLLLSLSGTQARRYIFPLFPPLALLAAWVLDSHVPVAALWIRRRVAPALLAVAALWLWISPPPFVNQSDRAIPASRGLLQSRIPREEPLTFLGRPYLHWPVANPLLYYSERYLEPSARSPDEALARASARRSRLLLCDRGMLPDVEARTGSSRPIITGRDWVVLDLSPEGPGPPGR